MTPEHILTFFKPVMKMRQQLIQKNGLKVTSPPGSVRANSQVITFRLTLKILQLYPLVQRQLRRQHRSYKKKTTIDFKVRDEVIQMQKIIGCLKMMNTTQNEESRWCAKSYWIAGRDYLILVLMITYCVPELTKYCFLYRLYSCPWN